MNWKSISVGFLRASLAMTAVLLFLFLSVQPVQAQVDTGSILGTIADASGAPISGAKVTLTNEGTGAALSFTTSADGVYKFTPLKIGSYKVTATFQGFQTTAQTNIAQTGRAELADVVRVAGDLEASGVFELRAHADVVKLIVAEKTSGMTDIASRLIEDALPASLRRTQGIDLRHVLIEGRAI